ncbi:MAG TPA: hypothetical protein VL463_23005 [Kofleriaceae bacterium]|nr:hypothetical protein [Kofleriaceae bacterium]
MWHPIGVIALIAGMFGGCSGNGCSCMTTLPNGFPSNERTPNAAQIRVSQTGLAQIVKDPASLIGGLLPGGLTFDVPANCGGSPSVCCPGGNPQTPCGPILIDLKAQSGDLPRLEIKPVQGKSHLDITVRARVKTQMDVPVNIPVFGDCGLAIDTAPGPTPDLQLDIPVDLVQDATAKTTRIDAPSVTVSNLTTDDVKLNGGIGCGIANLGLGFFLDTLKTTFQNAIKDALNNQACKKCPSGDKAECGPLASACTNNVCQEGSQCLQELGVTGRMSGGTVFSSLSPGTTGSIDLYEVAGGYANTDNNGIALGLLGGMLPSGAPRDRCGPPATAPAPVQIPVSTYFQGNKRPDTGDVFDVAIGVHKNQLDRFAYSAYDGGFLCLTVGTSAVDLINSDTFGLFLRSLSNLTSNETVPMALGLRPQSPPVITLGKNTFVDNGGTKTLTEPLLDVKFSGLEIDIFAQIEGQYVRLFTLVSDLDLPVGLDVGTNGDLTPVLGDLNNAFTNISVKNSDPMIESPDDLAKVFPMILQLALPKLAGGLGAIKVPSIGGLNLEVTSITAVDNDTFLAIFGNLKPPAMMQVATVDTTAIVTGVRVPRTEVFADPSKWSPERRPVVGLELGGSDWDLEWQVKIDDGLWSAWSSAPEPQLSSELFWLQGRHQIDVRARKRGEPLTADPTPVTVTALIDTQAPEAKLERVGDELLLDGRDAVTHDVRVRWRVGGDAWKEGIAPQEISLGGAPADTLEVELVDEAGNVEHTRGSSARNVIEFHGQPGTGGGCACNGSGGGSTSALAALIVLFVLVGPRRRKHLVVLLIGGTLSGCSCSHNACGDKDCLPGEVARGTIGRWNSVATDGTRTIATTYDQTLGDLVLVELGAGDPSYSVIDGVPAGVTPTYDPGTYRGGVEDPGPDVGAWSSVALASGKGRVAYQDRERHALRFAAESSGWQPQDVDVPMDVEQIGAYASLAIGADGRPAIAYIATGLAGENGTRTTELRLARANNASPVSSGDWVITKIATGVRGCAGLCGGDKCVKPATAGDPETCQTPTSDCDPACGSSDVCVAGACLKEDGNEVIALPGGVGMFANVVVLPDGRLAIIYYDMVRTALVAQVENSVGANQFSEIVLDGMDANDRGQWATAAVDQGGTVHVAYQDALTDEVFYTTLANNAAGTPELVDDGVRTGDRTHNVGGGATIWIDNGTPRIAYQDGLSADLVIASRGGGSWTHDDAATGVRLDGFHIAAPPAGGWLVWDGVDKDAAPASTLQVKMSP